MKINIVPDTMGTCPGCGAYWGHPDKALDFPNRSKVYDEQGEWWRCYNPACEVGYWVPGTKLWERQATPEEEAATNARVKAEVEAMMVGKKWKTVKLANGIEQSTLVNE